jgi:hypothetical protein
MKIKTNKISVLPAITHVGYLFVKSNPVYLIRVFKPTEKITPCQSWHQPISRLGTKFTPIPPLKNCPQGHRGPRSKPSYLDTTEISPDSPPFDFDQVKKNPLF